MERIPVEETSQVSDARRRSTELCRDLGLDEVVTGNAAIVVTELATNLVRHARGGCILLGSLASQGRLGIEFLALDRGPGMADAAHCLRDGYSTAGSLGTGLGAIRRLSSEFDIFSVPGSGTAIVSRIWGSQPVAAVEPSRFTVGTVCLPYHDDDPCGDAWAIAEFPNRLVVLVADGLGHGPDAAVAAQAAVAIFRGQKENGTEAIVEAIHAGLRSTRGAAVAVAELKVQERIVRVTGVGNISGRVVGAESSRHLVSHNGTAGGDVRKIQEFTVPWPTGGLLVFHSDGLATRWDIDSDLFESHPALVAGVLFRDFCRQSDDVTVLAIREVSQ